VIVGREGWLFYRKDLNTIITPWPFKKNLDKIIALNKLIKDRGSVLVVVPVPMKIEVMKHEFCGLDVPVVSNQKKRFIDALFKHGIHTIDLTDEFCLAGNRYGLYQKKDMHWDQAGVSLAAGVIAEKIKHIAGIEVGGYDYAITDTVIYKTGGLGLAIGDSLKYKCSVKRVVGRNGTYTGSDSSEVMIVGDSFSYAFRGFGASLGAHVAYNLKMPTYTWGVPGLNVRNISEIVKKVDKISTMPKAVVFVFYAGDLIESEGHTVN
jgi:hypothetical protein